MRNPPGRPTRRKRGWVYGVSTQLRKPAAALPDSRTAIVLADRQRALDQFFTEQFPNSKAVERKKKRDVPSALQQGYAAGRQTKINTPLNGGKSEQLALC